jgi:hypothetical protein
MYVLLADPQYFNRAKFDRQSGLTFSELRFFLCSMLAGPMLETLSLINLNTTSSTPKLLDGTMPVLPLWHLLEERMLVSAHRYLGSSS